jgi:hypothetical protein
MTADISTDLSSWSTTAASNQPDYFDSVGPNNLADNLRAIQAAVRLLHSSSTIASATTCDLSTVSSYVLSVTGTTTITGLGTMAAGVHKILIFAGALTFTHNATTLILPTAASITTAAGDVAIMLSEGSGNWRCISYMRKSGAPLTSVATFGDGTVGAPSVAFTSDTDSGIYRIGANNIGVAVNGAKVVDIAATGASVTGTFSASTTVTAGTRHESSASGYALASGAHALYHNGTALVLSESSTDVAKFNGSGIVMTGASMGVSCGSASASTIAYTATSLSSASFEATNYRTTDGAAVMFKGNYNAWAGSASYNALELSNSGGMFFRISTVGAVFADGAYSGSGADFAEYFLPVQGANLQPGDTVALSGEHVKLAGPHDEIIGVVSDTPTVAGDMNLKAEGGVLVGLIGKLWVKRGAPLNPAWRLLRAGVTHDRYLVR